MTLEELLNNCIQRGWKPRGKEKTKRLNYNTLYREVVSLEFDNYNLGVPYSLRDIVSKESNLWQFCVENGMVKSIWSEIEISNLNEWYWVVRDTDYQYRLIITSLKDESELEDFLLNSIIINND